MFLRVWIFLLIQLTDLTIADHRKGGSLSWVPTSPTSLTSPVSIQITERHSWTMSRYPCNRTTTNLFGSYNDTGSAAPATLICISSAGFCTSSLFQSINSSLACTDYSTTFQITSGVLYTTENIAINTIIDVASRGTSWAAEILTNGWSLVTHMDLTPINGKINSSPVTGSLPVFQFYIGTTNQVIQIMVNDPDPEQTVRCRWSYQMVLDECGNVCLDLPNAVMNPIDCSITWTPVLRAADTANGLTSSTYVIAITAEDFTNETSTTPLSSVPHQILVYVTTKASSVCSSQPSAISGFPRRNLACYAIGTGSTTYHFYSAVGCVNDSIVEFITSSPFNVAKTDVWQLGNSTTWGINITWTVLSNQAGLQPFCIAAVDNHGQMSPQYCQMLVVGSGTSTTFLNAPRFVQGTASPLGTVMSTQTRFSITATLPLKRTVLNGTYIIIYRTNPQSAVYTIDVKYSGDVFFENQTLVFFVKNPPWIPGVTYFVYASQGVGTADMSCGLEDGGFSSGYWVFTIWNPAVSLTTTPSTTTSTATTHTVTTRGINTTTWNTLFTTTGLPAITTHTTTSTTSSTSTTATTTTTTSATTTTTTTTTTTEYIPNADVIYPKDMERDCLQPVTIGAAVLAALIVPLHLYAMINLFVKMNSNFQKEVLKARNERRIRIKSSISRALQYEQEEEEALV